MHSCLVRSLRGRGFVASNTARVRKSQKQLFGKGPDRRAATGLFAPPCFERFCSKKKKKNRTPHARHLTAKAAKAAAVTGNRSAWARHDDIEEALDEQTGHVYFTDPRTGRHAWSFEVGMMPPPPPRARAVTSGAPSAG